MKHPLPSHPRAVVTGGASGLGRAFCLALADRGARLMIADIDEVGAAETKRLALGRGATEAITMRADVAVLEDVEALAERAQAAWGGADLVINNAGVATAGRVGETTMEHWRWLMSINLWGVIHGCHVFAQRFRAQGSGHIINVASAAGLLNAPEMGAYNVSKAGVIALSETLAAETRNENVHVTALCPSFFATNIGKNARGVESRQRDMVEKLMARARIDAEGVARHALRSVESGELHSVPMADARWLWRLKRATPGAFSALAAKGTKAMKNL